MTRDEEFGLLESSLRAYKELRAVRVLGKNSLSGS
jgi:hypothetical protein